jgi:hypothetical protein
VVLCFWHELPFILRPRIGWSYLLALKLHGKSPFFLPELSSAAWLLLLGVAFLRNHRPLVTYVASELFLALPTIIFTGSLIVLGGGHILNRVDAALPLASLALFTLFPLGLALRALWWSRHHPRSEAPLDAPSLSSGTR